MIIARNLVQIVQALEAVQSEVACHTKFTRLSLCSQELKREFVSASRFRTDCISCTRMHELQSAIVSHHTEKRTGKTTIRNIGVNRPCEVNIGYRSLPKLVSQFLDYSDWCLRYATLLAQANEWFGVTPCMCPME